MTSLALRASPSVQHIYEKKILHQIKLLLEDIKVLLKLAFYSAGIKSWEECVLIFWFF